MTECICLNCKIAKTAFLKATIDRSVSRSSLKLTLGDASSLDQRKSASSRISRETTRLSDLHLHPESVQHSHNTCTATAHLHQKCPKPHP